MERSSSPADEVLAHAAAQAAETDPVLRELDAALDADPLYPQACAKLDRLEGEATSGEVFFVRLLPEPQECNCSLTRLIAKGGFYAS